jgi:hypothetical protein
MLTQLSSAAWYVYASMLEMLTITTTAVNVAVHETAVSSDWDPWFLKRCFSDPALG